MTHKNILLITADDLFSLEAHRSVFGIEIKTPNIDSLANRGARFDRAFAPIAVCGPSRAATFTGLSPFQTGILDNQVDWRKILRPEHAWQYKIKRAGYWTATQGKIFHGHRAQPQSVYEALYDCLPFSITRQPDKTAERKHFGGMFGGIGFYDGEEQFYDTQVINMAIECLQSHDGKKPFYIEAGLHHPHTAFNNPARFFEELDVSQIIRPEAWDRGWEMLPFSESFTATDAGWENPKDWDEERVERWKLTVRNYIASVHFLDFSIGRLLTALSETGYAENTIVVFFSDHGYHLADRSRWHKMTAYEQSARAPLIIADPTAEARVVKTPVSLTDIGPTLLDYVGVDIPSAYVGQSLRPLIEGADDWDRVVPTFWFGSASVRIAERRLILWQDGSTEHYDVEVDPWQQSPIKDHPLFESDRERLLEAAEAWGLAFVEQGVDVSKPSPFVSYLGEQGGTERKVASGMVLMGSITDRARIPGHHTMWALPAYELNDVKIPPHVSVFYAAVRGSSLSGTFKIRGNEKNNRINVSLSEFDLIEADLGRGNNDFVARRSPTLVFGGDGNDTIRGGRFDDTIYAGAGNNEISGGAGNDTIYGGAGNDVLRGGPGNDVIHSGSGQNRIYGERGNNTIVLNGGTNQVWIGPGRDRVVIQRTARLQVILGFNGKQILDLSDFAAKSALKINKNAEDVAVICGRDRFIVKGAKVPAVRRMLRLNEPETAE